MTINRRRLLGVAGGVAGSWALSACGVSWNPRQTGETVRSALPLPPPFHVPLPIPKVLRPVRSDGTTDFFEIRQRRTTVELLPGVRTPIMGYDGTFPGPLVETRSGREAVVRHHNELDVPISVHLHGGHTPADSDGYPTDLVQPATVRDYVYPMRQRAATLWYHDHRMDFTGQHVYEGLFGMHVVRDDEDDALPLPRGSREIPLAIVDRSFDEEGRFAYPGMSDGEAGGGDSTQGHAGHSPTDGHGWVDDAHVEGVLGDVILVNGAPWPELEVDAARYRFRILNGCNARRLDLVLDPPPARGPAFVQVGSDGGLLERARPHEHLQIAQAERFDVLVDFSAYPVGTEVRLVNRLGTDGTAHVMRFVVARTASDDSAPFEQLPSRLSTIEPLDTTGARVREWRFSRGRIGGRPGWVINGEEFDPDRMDADVPLGEVEIWRFLSEDVHHPVHVHLDPFQVLSRGGHAPSEFDHGWKDTVDLRPAEHVDVAIRFNDYPGPFLIHCHNLEHEDRMMMAAFATHQ